MTATHTPARLTVRANGDANSYALLDDKGHWFMSMLVNGEQMTARQEANLRRMAACWNACEGISTEALETGPTMMTAYQREEDRADRAEVERDELLGLLSELLDTEMAGIACTGSDAPVEDLMGRIKLAAAKRPA